MDYLNAQINQYNKPNKLVTLRVKFQKQKNNIQGKSSQYLFSPCPPKFPQTSPSMLMRWFPHSLNCGADLLERRERLSPSPGPGRPRQAVTPGDGDHDHDEGDDNDDDDNEGDENDDDDDGDDDDDEEDDDEDDDDKDDDEGDEYHDDDSPRTQKTTAMSAGRSMTDPEQSQLLC